MSRTLVIADVHANAPALDAVLAAEPDRDSVLFLGDAVDCGPHPDAVCERLRNLDLAAGVVGNHDRTVLDAGETAPSGDSPRSRGSPPSGDPYSAWQAWTHARLSAESRAFLAALDRTVTVTAGGRTLRLHHGDFAPPEGHDGEWRTRLTPDDEAAPFEAVAARYDEEVVVHGHSHLPFETTVAGTTFVNPGSVGLQRDGWPVDRARYAVVADGAVDLRAVEYDPDPVTADSHRFDSPYDGHWTPSRAIADD